MALIFLGALLFRNEGRYRRIAPASVSLIAAALVGVVLVTAGQAGGHENLFSGTSSQTPAALAAGVSLGLSASFLVALGVCGFKWSSLLASDLAGEGGKESLEMFGSIWGIAVCNLASFVLTGAMGTARGEEWRSNCLVAYFLPARGVMLNASIFLGTVAN